MDGGGGGQVVEILEQARGSHVVLARLTVPRQISYTALRTIVASALMRAPDSFLLALPQEGELGGSRLRLLLLPRTTPPLSPRTSLIVPPARPVALGKPRSASFSGPLTIKPRGNSVRRRSLPSGRISLVLGPLADTMAPLVRPVRIAAGTSTSTGRPHSNSMAPPLIGRPSSAETLMIPRPETPTSARRIDVAQNEEINSEGLVLRKGEVIAASSEGILGVILGAQAPSADILDETLLTYRYWAAPPVFLALLGARFDTFGSASGELRGVLRLRVLSTLRRWVEAFFHDFERDETLLNRLLDFVDHALKTTHGTQLAKWSEKLKLFVHEQVNSTLTRKFPTHYLPLLLADEVLSARSGAVSGAALTEWLTLNLKIPRQKALIVGNQFTPRYFVPAAASKEHFFRDSREAVYVVQRATGGVMMSMGGAGSGIVKETKESKERDEEDDTRPKVASKHRSVDECSLGKVHATELARQLTLVEHELFRAIEPPELLFANWKRDSKRDLAPHVCAVIDHFNRTLRWATTEILSPPTSKLRRAALTKLVQVGVEFRKLNNYNGVMEIVSALQSAPVQRLKHTWRGMTPKDIAQFQELVEAMDFVHHLKRYRDDLEKIEPPALPYIGLFLQDLLMIEEIPTRARQDAGLINVGKLRKVTAVVRRIQRLQARGYLLKAQPAVHTWLASCTVLSDADIEQMSRTAEPV